MNGNHFNTETGTFARFTRTIAEVPQITFASFVPEANLLPEGFKTVGQAIAHGWVKNTAGEWINGRAS